MNFQKSVLVVAIILLIICLVLIGIALYNNKYSTEFPPVVANCPDYWIQKPTTDQNSITCYNIKNLGKSQCEKTMDFSGSTWTGNEGLCNKFRWASTCNLTWDGVTNNTDPCNNNTDDN